MQNTGFLWFVFFDIRMILFWCGWKRVRENLYSGIFRTVHSYPSISKKDLFKCMCFIYFYLSVCVYQCYLCLRSWLDVWRKSKWKWRCNTSKVWSYFKKLKFSVQKIITAICVCEFPKKISFDIFHQTFFVLGDF